MMDDVAKIPDEAELRAYLQGMLSAKRFTEVDAWVAQHQSSAEIDLLLLSADPSTRAIPALDRVQLPAGTFSVDAPRGRLTLGSHLGEGGMGVVRAARDRALQRTVALKILRVRQIGESLEAYLLREATFRREAIMTANLEHPAIVPLYEIGTVDGQPAFSMKRVEGRSFTEVVQDGTTLVAELITIVQRIAEAIAFAHHRGIVHRDLTPANVLVGDYGAAYVLDWGLAERTDTICTVQAGTMAWMAPEQRSGAPATPRMDVFALGGLLMMALTRQGPRSGDPMGQDLDLTPLDHPHVPRGLAAVARRCLAADADQRYANGEAVADELLRWQTEGLTLAQQVGHFHWWWLRLRRSPHLMTSTIVGMLAMSVLGGTWWWMATTTERRAHARISELGETVPLDRPEAIDLALSEVRIIRGDYPTLTEAVELESRLATAREVGRRMAERELNRERIGALLARTRQIGPWVNQVQAWREALRDAGLQLDATQLNKDVEWLRRSADGRLIAEALAFWWRAEREQSGEAWATTAASLLTRAGPTAGWRALGRILASTEFRAHDPVLGAGDDAQTVLAEPDAAAIALALFAPQRQLEDYARQRLEQAPGDFWALIAAGRAALAAHDVHESQHHALVASGAEPGSLLPRLILAYVALEQHTWPTLLEQVQRGLETDPANIELLTLQTIAYARLDRRTDAERILARLPAGHLRFHLAHRVGHPMELAVDALVAAGLNIPEAPPDLGPLAPGHEHRH